MPPCLLIHRNNLLIAEVERKDIPYDCRGKTSGKPELHCEMPIRNRAGENISLRPNQAIAHFAASSIFWSMSSSAQALAVPQSAPCRHAQTHWHAMWDAEALANDALALIGRVGD